jgi:hypothetical protein
MNQTTISPLEQATAMLLGPGEVMASVGRCFNYAWHAAQGGNWGLAAYFLRRTRKLLRAVGILRPKYADQIEAYEADAIAPLLAAAEARDLEAFERRYRDAVAVADRYHIETGHPYIRWRAEPEPPTDLDLGPPS